MREVKHLFSSGHTACAGCGQSLGARLVIDAAGPHTIATSATGCLEVFSTKYPESSWEIPWIHSLFENSAAVASGIEAALRYLGKLDKTRVIAQGGDGGTADIGLQALSGMMERAQDVLYVCLSPETELILGDGSVIEIGKFVDKIISEHQEEAEKLLTNCEKIVQNTSFSTSFEIFTDSKLIVPVKEDEFKKIEKVEIAPVKDKTVLSWNKSQFVPMNIVCAQRRLSGDTLVKITTSSGRTLSLTPEHPVLIDAINGPKWQRADLLKIKDEVYAPRKIKLNVDAEKEFYIVDFLDGNIKAKLSLETKEKINQELKKYYGSVRRAAEILEFKYWQLREKNRMVDLEGLRKIFAELPTLKWDWLREELAWFGIQGGKPIKIKEKKFTPDLLYILGLICADGYLNGKSYEICFINKEEILIKEFKRRYRKMFSGRKISEFRNNEDVIYLTIANPVLSILGKRLQIKANPKELIRLPEELISAFLRGYFDGDGYCGVVRTKHSFDPKVILSTIEEKLAKRLRQMLQRIGIACFQDSRKERFDLYISSREDIERFLNKVSSDHPLQKKKMKEIKKLWKTRNQRGKFFSLAPRICGRILKDICEKEGVPITKLDRKRNICSLAADARRATKQRIRRYRENLIKIIGEEKCDLFKGLDSYLRDDFYLDPIEKIEVQPPKSKFVYDITVENTHLFIPEGAFVISNCYDNEAYMNCLSTSSLIITKPGLKKITDIKVGDEIYAFDQKNYDLVLKKCTGIFDNGTKEVFKLETLHHTIKATSNHPFLVLSRENGNKFLLWKILKNIKIGEEVVVIRNSNDAALFKLNIKNINPIRNFATESEISTSVMVKEVDFSENKYFTTEKVQSIKSVGYEPTLDLRVEGEHNFVADGIVVHNTGVQRSGLTPFDSNTTTSPPGKLSYGNPRPKKNMVKICVAHGIPYVASASVGFPIDVQRKVKKALSIRGPKYIHLHVPCPLGWRHLPNLTINIAKLAVETGLYPLVEYENGKLVSVRKLKDVKAVEEYLKPQGRFAHLFKDEKDKQEIEKIQQIADQNIKSYNLKE